MIQNDVSPATSSVATLTISADSELLARLDGWIAAHVDPMSREEWPAPIEWSGWNVSS